MLLGSGPLFATSQAHHPHTGFLVSAYTLLVYTCSSVLLLVPTAAHAEPFDLHAASYMSVGNDMVVLLSQQV